MCIFYILRPYFSERFVFCYFYLTLYLIIVLRIFFFFFSLLLILPCNSCVSTFPANISFIFGCAVQFSHSVVSDSLRPHGLQHARLPCPSPAPRAYSNSFPSCWWWHPAISSSVVPFSSCLQSFTASRLFQWVSSLHQVARVSEFQFQHQFFEWVFRTDFL